MLFGAHERLEPYTATYWHEEHRVRYRFSTSFADGARVLDAGCGIGYGSDLMTGVASSVVGVDLSEGTVRQAGTVYRRPNLSFSAMDCRLLGFADDTFHLITSFEVIEHIKNYGEYLSELKRVLRAGGHLILSTPNRAVSLFAALNPYHHHAFTLDGLRELLGGVFNDVTIYGQESSTAALRLYHNPIVGGALRALELLGVKVLVPPFLKNA